MLLLFSSFVRTQCTHQEPMQWDPDPADNTSDLN